MAGALRLCYLILPALLTTVSLIFLIITLLNQWTPTSRFLTSLYFLRLDTTSAAIPGLSSTEDNTIKQITGIQQYYDVGLYNYCAGSLSASLPAKCSPRVAGGFVFNPLEVLGLGGANEEGLLPADWRDALNDYKTAVHVSYVLYILSLVFTAITLVLGIASFFLGRLTSIVVSISATLASVATVGASVVSVVLYVTVGGVIDDKLNKYGIHSALGTKLVVFSFLAAGFGLAANFLWFWGCCCRGRDRSSKRRGRGHSSARSIDEENAGTKGFNMGGAGVGVPWGAGQGRHYQRLSDAGASSVYSSDTGYQGHGYARSVDGDLGAPPRYQSGAFGGKAMQGDEFGYGGRGVGFEPYRPADGRM